MVTVLVMKTGLLVALGMMTASSLEGGALVSWSGEPDFAAAIDNARTMARGRIRKIFFINLCYWRMPVFLANANGKLRQAAGGLCDLPVAPLAMLPDSPSQSRSPQQV